MRNGFTTETRELFDEQYHCYWCGKNRWDAGHHILGRVSSSPYNFAPIHNESCHIWNSALDSFDVRKKFLNLTKKYLDEIGYRPNKGDLEFLNKYSNYYKQ